MRKSLSVLAILLSGCLVIGCSSDPASSRAGYIKQGDDFLAAGKAREAVVAYKNAVAADPQSGESRLKLAEAFQAAGDSTSAVREFVQAADRLPDDLAVQVRAAEVLTSVGRFEDARGRADKVLEKDPKNIDALVAKGNALAGLKDLAKAVELLEGVIRMNPNLSRVYSSLGTLQMTRGNSQEAEAAYKRAVFLAPTAVPPRLALANFYWSTGRRDEGEAMLAEAIKLEPRNLLANKALYLMFLSSRRIAEAEAPLKVIAENDPTAEGRLALADYYAATQRMAEAKAIYEAASSDALFGARAKLRLAALGLVDGDRAGAYRLVDEVLAKQPTNVEGLIGKSQLLLGDGKRQEALVAAQTAVSTAPGNPTAHYMVGLIRILERQPEEATAAFQESLRADFSYAPASFELARLSLAAGKYREAIQYARSALQFIPGYGDAHLLLARAEMLAGNAAAAEEPIRLLTTHFPDVPAVQSELGRLLLIKKDLAGARKAFQRAFDKDPTNAEAVEGLTVLDVNQGRSAAGRARLDSAVANGSKSVALLLVASNLYSTLFKDTAAAERAARQALTVDPNSPEAYGMLARLHIQQNNLADATVEFQRLADMQPKSVGNRTAVGTLLQLQNKLDDAKASYERALALDPRAPVAANNLAQLYVDRNESLDVALNLAQIAKAGLPDSHQVDDTLGWIYYKRGNGPEAVTALKRAVAGDPANAVYLYHLGAAYSLVKDKTNARQNLQKALSLQPGFAGAEDARRILNTLN